MRLNLEHHALLLRALYFLFSIILLSEATTSTNVRTQDG